MAHKDDPEKMAKLAAWLEAAAEELGVDPSVVTDNQTDLLGLIDTVAHGPSRPGAPLTAFLVGYARTVTRVSSLSSLRSVRKVGTPRVSATLLPRREARRRSHSGLR